MELIYDLVKSDFGVAIAWLCTVGSTIFSILKQKENKLLKVKIENISSSLHTDNGQDSVVQEGEKNVYTKHNSGGMKINM